MRIYKILTAEQWSALKVAGESQGAAVDLADGFIHFSTGEQVRETAAKHFAGQEGLMLLAYEAEGFGAALKWEPSRGGALFPHLYGPLPLAGIIWAVPLPLSAEGHVFPEEV